MSPPALPPSSEVKINSEETAAQPGQSGNAHLPGASMPTPAYQSKHEQYNTYYHYPQLQYHNQDYMQYYMQPAIQPAAATAAPGDMSGYPMMALMHRPPDQPAPDAERKRTIRLAKNRESVRIYRQKKREDEVRFRSCVDRLKADHHHLQDRVVVLEAERKQLKCFVDQLEFEKKQLKHRLDTLDLEKRGLS